MVALLAATDSIQSLPRRRRGFSVRRRNLYCSAPLVAIFFFGVESVELDTIRKPPPRKNTIATILARRLRGNVPRLVRMFTRIRRGNNRTHRISVYICFRFAHSVSYETGGRGTLSDLIDIGFPAINTPPIARLIAVSTFAVITHATVAGDTPLNLRFLD